MHRGLTFLQLSVWASSVYAAVPALPRSAYKLHDRDVASMGFITFALSKQQVSSRSPGTPTRPKRDNTYNIVTAVTPTATNAAGINQDGTDYSYFVEVQVGSAKKPMYMLLDTGASTTWVMGSSCTSTSCEEHNTFGPDDSESYKDSGTGFSVEYGTGSVDGTIVQDDVLLAGISVNLSFGVANTTSDQFTQFPFDGILGLSTSDNTWLAAVMEAKLISSNIFGVSLSRNSDGVNNGEIIFGTTDSSKFTGDFTYTGVDADGVWSIPMDDISVGGSAVGITGRSAYIDTGTSFVFGPPDDVKTLYGKIDGSSSSDGATYKVPCDYESDVAFTFAGQSWTISAADFISKNSDDTCTGNIYGVAYVPDGWLLGDTFLKNVYSVFDADNSQIGFAAKAEAPASPTTTSSSASSSGTPTPTTSMSAPASSTTDSMGLGLNGQETTTPGSSGDTTAPEPTDDPAPDTPKGKGDGGKVMVGGATALLAFMLSSVAIVLV